MILREVGAAADSSAAVAVDVNDPARVEARAIRCLPGELAPHVLLPGDPARAVRIARDFMDGAKAVVCHREFTTFTGEYEGTPVSVTSTGIGGAGAAMVVEDLARLGVRTAIRVGTEGSVQPSVHPGDIVIATGAVRNDGVTDNYVPAAFPAVADRSVLTALVEAAGSDSRVHEGLIHTSGGFRTPHLAEQVRTYGEAGVLAFEMEAATVLLVSQLRGIRAGAIVAIDGYAANIVAGDLQPDDVARDSTIEFAITCALNAIRALDDDATTTMAPHNDVG